MNDPRLIRIKGLDSNIFKCFEVLQEVENSLICETDPLTKMRYEDHIRRLRGLILEWSIEKEEIYLQLDKSMYVQDTVSASMIADAFDSLMQNEGSSSEALIIIREIQNMLEVIKITSDVPEAAREKVKVADIRAESSDKLKLIIPIIPFLLQFEKEIAIKANLSISKLWRKVLDFVKKDRKHPA